MWEFPSIQSFITNNLFIAGWTLAVFIYSAFCWILIFRSIKNNSKDSSGKFIKNIFIGSITFLIVFFSIWGLISRYNEVSNCRTLELEKVKAIRAEKMPDEYSVTGLTVLFDNSNKVQEGLRMLANADSIERKKINGSIEQFTKGYRIQIILEDNLSAPVLNYFSETDNFQETDIIIPRCDGSSNEIKSTDDIYSSPNFGNWIRENVKPEFDKIQ